MTDHSQLDAHVKRAWQSRKFSDGAKIDLGRTDDEQGFIVRPDGIFEVEVVERGVRICSLGGGRKEERVYTRMNLKVLGSHAGGHTHPKGKDGRISQKPGPKDGHIARYLSRNGKPSYVIANAGAYAVEWNGSAFDIRTLIGKRISGSVARNISEQWVAAMAAAKPGAANRVCD